MARCVAGWLAGCLPSLGWLGGWSSVDVRVGRLGWGGAGWAGCGYYLVSIDTHVSALCEQRLCQYRNSSGAAGRPSGRPTRGVCLATLAPAPGKSRYGKAAVSGNGEIRCSAESSRPSGPVTMLLHMCKLKLLALRDEKTLHWQCLKFQKIMQ